MSQADKPAIIVPDDIGSAFRSSPGITRLTDVATVTFHEQRAANEDELIDRIRGANIVLSFRPAFTKFPKRVLEGAPHLRMICISGTGVEDVDVAEATARRIAVANVPGPSNRAVAEHCIALLFAVARSIGTQDRAIRRGHSASSA
jgi:phosphoglycerate dehydrogenase-like enzyme